MRLTGAPRRPTACSAICANGAANTRQPPLRMAKHFDCHRATWTSRSASPVSPLRLDARRRPCSLPEARSAPRRKIARRAQRSSSLSSPAATLPRPCRRHAPSPRPRPNQPAPQVLLGNVLARQKDWPGARQAFTRALQLAPGNIDAIAGLSGVDIATGATSAGVARVETALRARPDDGDTLMLAAQAYTAAKDLGKAETTLRKLIEVRAVGIPEPT